MQILILSTYPASARDSGGVLRLRALRDAFEAGGHKTHVLAVVTPGPAESRTADETILPVAEALFCEQDRLAVGYHDILTGLRCLDDRELLKRAEALAGEFRPDAIMIEQPFLVGLAQHLQAQSGALLIYSAANLEAELKRALIALVPQYYRHEEDLLSAVSEAERRAASSAELTIAIAPTLAGALESWGARSVRVFGNGTGVVPASQDRHPLQAMLNDAPQICFGCFGSAYWPNLEGFASIMAPSLAFLPPSVKVLMTGRFHEEVRAHLGFRRGAALNDTRVIGYPHLSGPDFAALVAGCDALLLPVFVGSGSPLKTADALASGRPVLMSRLMAAGYEDIIAACPDGVRIVEDAAAFRAAWKEWADLGKAGLAALAGDGACRAALLRWSKRLDGLSEAVGALSNS